MELKFLGRGSAYNPLMKNTSAYFIQGRDLFLIDCGESVFEAIFRRGLLAECERIHVLITHLHADHVGSLGSLVSYCYYGLGKQAQVIHPSEAVVRLLGLVGIEPGCYVYHQSLPCEGNIQITAVPVEHVPDMDCYGYLIDDGKETIYYSGDAKAVPQEILRRFLVGTISRCYQDTSSQRAGHPTHCYIGDLESVVPVEDRKRVFCMHLDGAVEPMLQERSFGVVTVEE